MSISGGAFNPAVTVSAAVEGMFAWSTLWVSALAQLIAGNAVGLAFVALNRDAEERGARESHTGTD